MAKAKGCKREAKVVPEGQQSTSGTPRSGKFSAAIDLPMKVTTNINPRLIEPDEPMTEKQLLFTELLFHGYTPWKAFSLAYGVTPTKGFTDRVNLVRRVLWSKTIRNRMAQLQRAEVMADFDNVYNRRLFVLQGLTDLAQDLSISPMARLKALELLGKVRGTDLFTDRVETTHQSMTDEQVRAALSEKLAQLGLPQVGPETVVIEHKKGEET